ncbi:MAG: glycosyltransferase [bacterium]|nr:glycosyltransferase [bacterium]
MKKLPFASIIIVNYNGAHLLGKCLDSLNKSSYPKKSFEVVVVDNCSRDGSRQLIKQRFPQVKLIGLSENKGFAAGNNEGLKYAKGDYILLLNSDTEVDPEWMQEMVTAAFPKNVGIVAPKILLNTPFVEATIQSSVVQQSDFDQSIDFSPRGVLLQNVTCSNKQFQNKIWYKSGFNEPVTIEDITARWTTGSAKILLPLSDEVDEFTFIMHGYPTQNQKLISSGTITIAGEMKIPFSITPNSIFRKKIILNKARHQNNLIWLVQNAGNLVLKDGYSKDIGSVTRVINKHVDEFYEEDSKFFSEKQNLIAACGAGMLIKRSVIDVIGFFNAQYFMYYEDIDLSLRTWKQGWDIVYAPNAVISHAHRATTGKVESSFFLSMVEKNHLFLLLTHFPLTTFLKEYFLFGCRLATAIMKQFVFRFLRWDKYQIWRVKTSGRVGAFFSFHSQLLTFIKIRFWWQRREIRSYNQLEKHLY